MSNEAPNTRSTAESIEAARLEAKNFLTETEKEILGEIQGTVIQIKGEGEKAFEDMSPEELSQLAARLSVLSVNLGEMIAKAQREWKITDETAKFRRARLREIAQETMASQTRERERRQGLVLGLDESEIKYSKKAYTVGDVDAFLTSQTFDLSIRSAFYEENHSKLQHLWWSVKHILSALEHRMIILQSRMKVESYSKYAHVDDLPPFVPIPPREEE